MKYLLFKKNLLQVMGENARKDFLEFGLDIKPMYQFPQGEEVYTIAKIVDENRAMGYMVHPDCEVLSLMEANAKIDELYVPRYFVKNEVLMGASLNQKVLDGTISLDEMSPDWSEEQELEWLYNNGVSGIKKSLKPLYFNE